MATIGKVGVFGEGWLNVLRMYDWTDNAAGTPHFSAINPTNSLITNGTPQQREETLTARLPSLEQSVGGKSILIRASGTGDDSYDPRTAFYRKIDDIHDVEDPSEEELEEIATHFSASQEWTIQQARMRFEPYWEKARQSEAPITSLIQLGLESEEISKTIERIKRFSRLVELGAPYVIIAHDVRMIFDGMGVSTMGVSEDESLVNLACDGQLEAPFLDYAYGIFHRTTGLQIRFSQLTELDDKLRQFFANLEAKF